MVDDPAPPLHTVLDGQKEDSLVVLLYGQGCSNSMMLIEDAGARHPH